MCAHWLLEATATIRTFSEVQNLRVSTNWPGYTRVVTLEKREEGRERPGGMCPRYTIQHSPTFLLSFFSFLCVSHRRQLGEELCRRGRGSSVGVKVFRKWERGERNKERIRPRSFKSQSRKWMLHPNSLLRWLKKENKVI